MPMEFKINSSIANEEIVITDVSIVIKVIITGLNINHLTYLG